MYKIDTEGIEEKIRESRFSENEDVNKSIRNSLLAIMKELCDYTNEVNEALVDNAYKQEDHNRIKEIYTGLLPVGDDAKYEAAGLYKMMEAIPQRKRIFLDCEYDEIRRIVGDLSKKKIYKGSYIKDGKDISFDYSLEFDNSFLKAQEILFRYAEQYNVKNSIILSPYSHKSFFVKYDANLSEEDDKLDFCFKDNHIPVVDGNNCLYWNIRQSEENGKIPDDEVPYGDTTKYIYTFGKTKKGNKLPLPLPLIIQTRIYEIKFDESEVQVTTSHDMEDFIVFEYMDLDLNSKVVKERQSNEMLFGNKLDDGIQKQRRLLSEGDIERAIGCFREWQDMRCERSDGEGDHSIVRYSKKYRADRKDKNLFHTISTVHIRFKKTDKKFLTDYANYILEYLEYYYPEIEWAGEV